MSKPALELTASIGGPSGRRWRYAPAARNAGDRPLDLSFTTEAGEGFGTGQLTLSRPYDQDSPDLSLLGDVVIEGYDGQIAYEGRVQGTPRSLTGQGPQIRMDLQGWMSHARQQPFVDLIIDRDLSQWGPMDSRYKARAPGSYSQLVNDPVVDADGEAVTFTFEQFTGSYNESGMASYRASGPLIHCLAIKQLTRPNDPDWHTDGYIYADSQGLDHGVTATKTNSDDVILAADGLTYAYLASSYFGSFTGTFAMTNRFLPVVFGPIWAGQSPNTEAVVALSDVLKYLLGRYAPKLDLSRMVNNGYPVKHAVWREPTTCHDAVRELNVYAQWALGVYENREVEYRPFDLSTYDWQVRAGQDGVEVETQGVTIEGAFNGVTVSWPDYAGGQNTLTPDDTTELRDSNPAIAANQWGDRQWANLSLSRMTSQEGAITQARLYLADLNRPKFPSTITVPGHIKDSRGHWQPAWRVRANQTISIRNHPNDAPRLITSTSWQGNRLQITTDNALNRFEAITARLDRARADKGM